MDQMAISTWAKLPGGLDYDRSPAGSLLVALGLATADDPDVAEVAGITVAGFVSVVNTSWRHSLRPSPDAYGTNDEAIFVHSELLRSWALAAHHTCRIWAGL